MTRIDPAQLKHENLIIWIEDVTEMPYVRELLLTGLPSRARRPPQWSCPHRLVGYATLSADAPNSGYPMSFTRRLFWLNKSDLERHRLDVRHWPHVPVEAVDPKTVRPGVPGRMPE